MRVSYNGVTDYTFKPQRSYMPKFLPKFNGNYGVNGAKFRSYSRLFAAVMRERGLTGYLITMTFPTDYTRERRVMMRRKFLDNLRKKGCPYMWVTELHKGHGKSFGKHHYHIMIGYRGIWDYRREAIKWSQRYCGGVNGLDIKKRSSITYLAKYVTKDDHGSDGARQWGYRGVKAKKDVAKPHVDSLGEFIMRSRASCHVYTGVMKINDTKTLAKLWEDKMEYKSDCDVANDEQRRFYERAVGYVQVGLSLFEDYHSEQRVWRNEKLFVRLNKYR